MFIQSLHSLIGSVLVLTASSGANALGSTSPQVTVKNGTYAGIHSLSYNQDFFLGIPYALPPARFSLSEPINSSWTGVRNATEFGNICYGYGSDSVRLAALGFTVSEDCLSINVVRPSGYNGTLLPVGVYIHGGGYYMGGSSDPRLNFSYIVNNSVAANVPIMAVSFNYRLSGFGFLAGSEILKAGVANLGFRDQRLALQWLQENIAAFGGDPTKITIWGNSAGAGSVGAHLLAYGGRDDGLFNGAISESGSPAGFSALSEFLPVATWDEVYANLTTGTDCQDAADTLDCLRNAPITTISDLFNTSKASGAATSGANYGLVLDGDFVADIPTRQMKRGEFVKVPYLMGSNTDEGSSFIPGNNVDSATNYPTSKIDNDEQFFADLKSMRLNDTVVEKLAVLYPQNSSEQAVANYHNTLPAELGVQYKRGVTFYGDSNIIAPTRYAATKWAQFNVTAFTYRWNVIVAGLPAFIGATHAKEIVFVFDDHKAWDYNINPFLNKPQSYYGLAEIMSTAWATFIATGNPNGQDGINGTVWPKYDTVTPENFVFDANVTSHVEPDTVREDAIAYMMELYSEA